MKKAVTFGQTAIHHIPMLSGFIHNYNQGQLQKQLAGLLAEKYFDAQRAHDTLDAVHNIVKGLDHGNLLALVSKHDALRLTRKIVDQSITNDFTIEQIKVLGEDLRSLYKTIIDRLPPTDKKRFFDQNVPKAAHRLSEQNRSAFSPNNSDLETSPGHEELLKTRLIEAAKLIDHVSDGLPEEKDRAEYIGQGNTSFYTAASIQIRGLYIIFSRAADIPIGRPAPAIPKVFLGLNPDMTDADILDPAEAAAKICYDPDIYNPARGTEKEDVTDRQTRFHTYKSLIGVFNHLAATTVPKNVREASIDALKEIYNQTCLGEGNETWYKIFEQTGAIDHIKEEGGIAGFQVINGGRDHRP